MNDIKTQEIAIELLMPYSEAVLETRMRPLVGNRVLYPDGTVNSFVQRYLRDKVLKLFEKKQKKSTQRTD